jgi:hypothetical protein
MDRFLDEQENHPAPPRERSSSPSIFNSLLFGDPKRSHSTMDQHYSSEITNASSEDIAAAIDFVKSVAAAAPASFLNPDIVTTTSASIISPNGGAVEAPSGFTPANVTVSTSPVLSGHQSVENMVHIASFQPHSDNLDSCENNVTATMEQNNHSNANNNSTLNDGVHSDEPSPKRLKIDSSPVPIIGSDIPNEAISVPALKDGKIPSTSTASSPIPTVHAENHCNISNVELSTHISSVNALHSTFTDSTTSAATSIKPLATTESSPRPATEPLAQ